MTVYEQELRKLFEHSNLVDRLNSPGVCAWEISERTCVYGRSFSLPISPANMTPSASRCSTARRRGGPDAAALSGCLG